MSLKLNMIYIASEWAAGSNVNRNINPSNTGDVVGEYVRSSEVQALQAIDAAYDARITWQRRTAEDRSDALDRIGTEILARRASSICTTFLKHATDFKHSSTAGMVMVNVPIAGVDYHAPFGGRKGSSDGSREQGTYARKFYTADKTTHTQA